MPAVPYVYYTIEQDDSIHVRKHRLARKDQYHGATIGTTGPGEFFLTWAREDFMSQVFDTTADATSLYRMRLDSSTYDIDTLYTGYPLYYLAQPPVYLRNDSSYIYSRYQRPCEYAPSRLCLGNLVYQEGEREYDVTDGLASSFTYDPAIDHTFQCVRDVDNRSTFLSLADLSNIGEVEELVTDLEECYVYTLTTIDGTTYGVWSNREEVTFEHAYVLEYEDGSFTNHELLSGVVEQMVRAYFFSHRGEVYLWLTTLSESHDRLRVETHPRLYVRAEDTWEPADVDFPWPDTGVDHPYLHSLGDTLVAIWRERKLEERPRVSLHVAVLRE